LLRATESPLVAGPVGIVPTAISAITAISSIGGGSDGGSSHPDRHATAYGCTTIHAGAVASVSASAISSAVSTTVVDAGAMNAAAAAVRGGVS
jgi:hypothetical protein